MVWTILALAVVVFINIIIFLFCKDGIWHWYLGNHHTTTSTSTPLPDVIVVVIGNVVERKKHILHQWKYYGLVIVLGIVTNFMEGYEPLSMIASVLLHPRGCFCCRQHVICIMDCNMNVK